MSEIDRAPTTTPEPTLAEQQDRMLHWDEYLRREGAVRPERRTVAPATPARIAGAVVATTFLFIVSIGAMRATESGPPCGSIELDAGECSTHHLPDLMWGNLLLAVVAFLAAGPVCARILRDPRGLLAPVIYGVVWYITTLI